MKKIIELGTCKKPHGIRGAFSFYLINSEESSLKKGTRILCKPLSPESSLDEKGESFEILSINFGNKTIVTLNGVNSRNEVEAMIPFEIFVEREELPELKEGEFYLNDLIEMKVFDHDGNLLGTVVSLSDNGVQDIIHVQTEDEVLEVLLVDAFVKEINLEEEKIVIALPEYL